MTESAFLEIWPRGFAKSTHLELATVYLGAKGSVQDEIHEELEADFHLWLYTLFPEHMGGATPTALAPYHEEFWRWVEALPTPRKYALYVSDTQDQADQHVSNIAEMLTSAIFAAVYPLMARRQLTKFGATAGWRRNRLRTASGYTVDAAGLLTGIRGARVGTQRPDVIGFDDLDDTMDSPTVTERKERNLTRSIIPAQGDGCVFIGAQNLVVRGGIFTKLADGTADYLRDRVVSGPHPALLNFDRARDLRERPDGTYQLIGGTPTWRNRAFVEGLINTYGPDSFMVECQHELSSLTGLVFGTFDPLLHEYRYKALPQFESFFGGADFGGEGDTAHNSALTLVGITTHGRRVLLREWYANGANVFERQHQTMTEWDREFGHIRWCIDGDERTTFQTLRTMGFDVTMSDRAGGSVETRIRRLGRLLAVGAPPSLLEAPGPQPGMRTQEADEDEPERPQAGMPGFFYLRACRRFRHEIERWRRPPRVEGVPYNDKPVAVDDDVLVSALYALERAAKESTTGIASSTEVRVA